MSGPAGGERQSVGQVTVRGLADPIGEQDYRKLRADVKRVVESKERALVREGCVDTDAVERVVAGTKMLARGRLRSG